MHYSSLLVFFGLAGLGAPGYAQSDLEVSITPGNPVYVLEADRRRGTFDLMVQNVIVANTGESPREMTGGEVRLSREGEVRASLALDPSRFVSSTAELGGMQQSGFSVFAASQLLNIEIMEMPVNFSRDRVVEPGETLLATGTYLAVPFEPDELTIAIRFRSADDGTETAVSTSRPVRRHVSSIDYGFPLRGIWNMRGLPGVRSHHRTIPANEFAVDFFKLGEDGALHAGDSLNADNHFGYGEAVYAAAAGEVVSVIANATQDRSARAIGEDETREEARRRIQRFNMQRIMADFRSALAGNIVTIRHEGADGTVEYSSYGHLATDSVSVAVGDHVERGQRIAAVGDTGDSDVVHLHFQLNAGPDPFFSRSLPVQFSDMRETFGGQDAGIFVRYEPTGE